MNLQVSLPFKSKCVYSCPFCCNTTHTQYQGDTLPPLEYANKLSNIIEVDGYRSIMITGENEPMQNMDYIAAILTTINPTTWVEITTRGYKWVQFMEKYPKLVSLINVVNFSVSETILAGTKITYSTEYDTALEVASITTKKHPHLIKRFTFLLTNTLSPHMVRHAGRSKWVDQITMKQLQGDTKYIKKNSNTFVADTLFLEAVGTKRDKTERFNIFMHGDVQMWIDNNCQDGDGNYVIFRPDGNLYAHWESTEPMNA